jgi:hypothetical protein
MLASLKLGADFSRWCAHPAMRPPIPATHPRPSICESTLEIRSSSTPPVRGLVGREHGFGEDIFSDVGQ